MGMGSQSKRNIRPKTDRSDDFIRILHTFAPSSVTKQDFRTGGSVKHNFPYWFEIPNWFRTIQNWVGTIQTISKTLSDLVSYWWDQKHAATKNMPWQKVSYWWFRLFVLLVMWNSSFRTKPIVFVLFVLVGSKVCCIDVKTLEAELQRDWILSMIFTTTVCGSVPSAER